MNSSRASQYLPDLQHRFGSDAIESAELVHTNSLLGCNFRQRISTLYLVVNTLTTGRFQLSR